MTQNTHYMGLKHNFLVDLNTVKVIVLVLWYIRHRRVAILELYCLVCRHNDFSMLAYTKYGCISRIIGMSACLDHPNVVTQGLLPIEQF